MVIRRKFLKASVGVSALSSSGPGRGADTKPIVVSTWDFGRAASAGAWEVLRKGGRAPDAVEQGVRIPEADPSDGEERMYNGKIIY